LFQTTNNAKMIYLIKGPQTFYSSPYMNNINNILLLIFFNSQIDKLFNVISLFKQ